MTEEFWLTYTEAAGKLGIKLDSVKRRVRARKWPRMTGNDGIVRIQIPHDALPDDRTEGRSVNQAEPDVDLADVSARLTDAEIRAAVAEARADALSERLTEAKEDRDKWQALAERLSQPRPSIWDRLLKR